MRTIGGIIRFACFVHLLSAGSLTFSVTPAGVLSGGNFSSGLSMNSQGWVAGFGDTSSSSGQAFVWNLLSLSNISPAGSPMAFGNAIGPSGNAAGYALTADLSAYNAFLYSGSAPVAIPTLGGTFNAALGINGAGTVVGFSQDSSGAVLAFQYSGGAMTSLGTLPGGTTSQASAINASGQIAGYGDTADGSTHAFLWSGAFTDLGVPAGFASSYASGIGNAGAVAGYVTTGTVTSEAFLWTSGGGMTLLGTLGGDSKAFGVNASGMVVGSSNGVAFLYANSQMYDLNTLLDSSGIGWQLQEALAINDLGQITGTGLYNGVQRAFLLTIVPASQTITFSPLPDVAFPSSPFAVSATASSGLPVTFSSLSSTVCMVLGTTVTLVAPGTCTIQAIQTGDSAYLGAPSVSRSFQVTGPVAIPGATSLSFPNTVVGAATTQTVSLQNSGTSALTIASIQATGADAGNYRYIVDSSNPCPIAPVTLNAGAACMLDVSFAPGSQGAHNAAWLTLTDNSGNVSGTTETIALSGTGIVLSSIAVTANSASLAYNTSETFTATGTYSDNSTVNLTSQVTWHSSATGVATIDNQGMATAVSPGQTNITASANGVTSNSFQLTVVPGAPAAISVSGGSGQRATVGRGFAAVLQALVKDGGGDPVSNAAVTFTAPTSGAGATFSNGLTACSATTNSMGVATSLAFTANATAGGYPVTAAVTGVTSAAAFALTNLSAAALSIGKSHTGQFAQGDPGDTYTVTVWNAAGAGATSGMVTVTEEVPAGMSLVSMGGGTTWNCTVLPKCTTSTVLGAGQTYPAITVTVSVANNAPATLTNQVTVSGGSSAPASVSNPAGITPISSCNVTRSGSTGVPDVQMVLNEVLGNLQPVHFLSGGSTVGVTDVQIVVDAVMGMGCAPVVL